MGLWGRGRGCWALRWIWRGKHKSRCVARVRRMGGGLSGRRTPEERRGNERLLPKKTKNKHHSSVHAASEKQRSRAVKEAQQRLLPHSSTDPPLETP